MHLIEKNDEFDPIAFLTRLAAETNFSDNWPIGMLNFFYFDWQKTNMNDNLKGLNLGFERSKLLRTKLNWE